MDEEKTKCQTFVETISQSISKFAASRSYSSCVHERERDWYFFETTKLLNNESAFKLYKLFAEHGLLTVRFLGVREPAV